MIIYKTTNLINGKGYVGYDTRNNPKYLGSGIYLNAAIKKYGIENFKKEIIEDNIFDINFLAEREMFWIKKLNTRAPNGYNLSDGGLGGKNPTESVRLKLREQKLGNKNPAKRNDVRKKMSLAKRKNMGRNFWNRKRYY